VGGYSARGIHMKLPICFPHEGDQIHKDAMVYRRLAPTDRLLALADLIASATTLLKESPRRDIGSRLQQVQEAEWRRIQKELFARHGR
jgi:hypothetical protein